MSKKDKKPSPMDRVKDLLKTPPMPVNKYPKDGKQ